MMAVPCRKTVQRRLSHDSPFNPPPGLAHLNHPFRLPSSTEPSLKEQYKRLSFYNLSAQNTIRISTYFGHGDDHRGCGRRIAATPRLYCFVYPAVGLPPPHGRDTAPVHDSRGNSDPPVASCRITYRKHRFYRQLRGRGRTGDPRDISAQPHIRIRLLSTSGRPYTIVHVTFLFSPSAPTHFFSPSRPPNISQISLRHRPQHFLYFLPLPQGHGALRGIWGPGSAAFVGMDGRDIC
jgi:hypothetical protein